MPPADPSDAAPTIHVACEMDQSADDKCAKSVSPIQISYSNHQKRLARRRTPRYSQGPAGEPVGL